LLGKVDSIYTTDNGIKVPLPFNPESQIFDEHDKLTIAPGEIYEVSSDGTAWVEW
jgi:hypothetical protein